MALRVARGLFRLWLVLSVLWVAGVAFVTWQTFLVIPTTILSLAFLPPAFVLALLPPVFVLALGSALVWAFRSFR